MRSFVLVLSLFLFLLAFPLSISARQSDRQIKDQIQFLMKFLAVDSVKAKQVVLIQRSYKARLKLITAESNLSEEVTRARLQELIQKRNQRLASILNEVQYKKIVPATESRNEGSIGAKNKMQ